MDSSESTNSELWVLIQSKFRFNLLNCRSELNIKAAELQKNISNKEQNVRKFAKKKVVWLKVETN